MAEIPTFLPEDLPPESGSKRAEIIPEEDILRYLRMLRLPQDTEKAALKKIPLKALKKQYMEILAPEKFQGVLAKSQFDLMEARYIETINALNNLILWQQGKLRPVAMAPRERAKEEAGEKWLQELVKDEKEMLSAWDKDEPERMKRIEAERQAQLKSYRAKGEKVIEQIQRDKQLEEFDRFWNRVVWAGGTPTWWKSSRAFRGSPEEKKLRNAAFLLFQRKKTITREVVRALEQRLGLRYDQWSPEAMKKASEFSRNRYLAELQAYEAGLLEPRPPLTPDMMATFLRHETQRQLLKVPLRKKRPTTPRAEPPEFEKKARARRAGEKMGRMFVKRLAERDIEEVRIGRQRRLRERALEEFKKAQLRRDQPPLKRPFFGSGGFGGMFR